MTVKLDLKTGCLNWMSKLEVQKQREKLTFSFGYRWQEIGGRSETADARTASGCVCQLRFAERRECTVELAIECGQIFDHQIQRVDRGALKLGGMHMGDGSATARLVGQPVERILAGFIAFAAL